VAGVVIKVPALHFTTKEKLMEFNPIEVQKHLKGADYPASGEELASLAESNNAPEELVEKLRSLGNEEFSGPDKVMAALKRRW
jgi:hypothetical protein